MVTLCSVWGFRHPDKGCKNAFVGPFRFFLLGFRGVGLRVQGVAPLETLEVSGYFMPRYELCGLGFRVSGLSFGLGQVLIS